MTDGASLVGRTLAHYRILEPIGTGGMAMVHLAEDVRHARKVAVKVLRPEIAAALGHERFLREITTTAGLRHPHILPLYDSGTAEARAPGESALVYYVMPYVEGESLRDRLKREKQLPVDEALRIAREVCDALSYAHSRGVIHRDIKPENILLESGHAVVADFGIARALDAAGGARLTETGLAIGTPAYMSPEQAAGQRDVDGRSDLYALACVLYEMLAGHPPFSGPTVESVVHQHLVVEAPTITHIRPAVPTAVATALARALSKTPADRYQSADRFAESIVPRTDTVVPLADAPRTDARAPGADGLSSIAAPDRAVGRRGRRLLTATALVLLAVAAMLWRALAPATVAPSDARIAVLPFAPAFADSVLERFGRDLAVTVTANLDGMGELHTVDALTTLAAAPRRGAVALDEAHRLARRLGATRLIHGTLTQAGGVLRLDAALYDVGSNAPLVRVSTSAADLSALSDAATIALLDQLWQHEPPLAASLAAVRRSSVPAARRAYLAGELALSRTEWQAAIDEFERAFAADTTFWWAYWRSLYPRTYRETERADPVLVQKIVDHRHELPEPDRLLIEATWMARSLTERLARLRQLTDRFSSYEPALWAYANMLVHNAGYVGHSPEDARAALERVLALNPRFAAAWDHLQWIAIIQGDTATTVRAAQEAERLVGEAEGPEHEVRRFRAQAFGARGVPPEQVGRFVDAVSTFPPGLAEIAAAGGPLSDGEPVAQIQLNRAVRARSPTPALVAALWEGEALAWAARGAWDSALVAAARWARLPGGDGGRGAYRLAVGGTVLGAVAPSEARTLRPSAPGGTSRPATYQRSELAWLDGVLAYVEGNGAGIAAARRALGSDPVVSPWDSISRPMLDRSLAALALDAAGERERAADEMVALETEMADRFFMNQAANQLLLTTVNRLLAVRWLRSLGRDGDAVPLLAWHEAIPHGSNVRAWNVGIGSITLLDRAEIAEMAGDARSALRDYTRLLQWYDLADPALQPVVRRARAGIARLAGESGR
jgi:TolB-like protein